MQNNELNFIGQNVYVGFDVHLKDWKVSIMVDDIHHKTFSQDPSPQQLARYLQKNFPSANYFSAYEAGYCGFWIHHELKSLGINSIVVNPADIPTTGKETVQKEDRRDSLKIVKSLRAGLLQPIYTPSQENIDDRCLLRVRTMITKNLAQAKNRLKSYLYFLGIVIPQEFQKQSKSWTHAYTRWLENIELTGYSKHALNILLQNGIYLKEIKRSTTRQLTAISRTAKHQKNYNLLRSVPGIGNVNAMTFLLELGDIQRFKTTDQFCSYVGLVPSTRSSGDREKAGNITPRKNKLLRSALIESAWVAIRRDPALMQKYITLLKRMDKNSAIVRIAKSLSSRILFVLKNQSLYQTGIVK